MNLDKCDDGAKYMFKCQDEEPTEGIFDASAQWWRDANGTLCPKGQLEWWIRLELLPIDRTKMTISPAIPIQYE